MKRPDKVVAFAQTRARLNSIFDKEDNPDDLRGTIVQHRALLRDLYNSIAGDNDSSEERFVEAVIGDNRRYTRLRILAIILALDTVPTAEIWPRFLAALSLAEPELRHEDFRDECLPGFGLAYIEQQLGEEFASRFEAKYHEVCFFSPVNYFEDRLRMLSNLVEQGRCTYQTVNVTERFAETGTRSKHEKASTEGTGYFWPDDMASKLVAANKGLVRSFYVEHTKGTNGYPKTPAAARSGKVRAALQSSKRFLIGVGVRAKVMAILLYSGASHKTQAWDVFIENCMWENNYFMLDASLPFTHDTLRRMFGPETSQYVLDNFHDRQYAFCPLRIRTFSAVKQANQNRISFARAHFPFTKKIQCGNRSSSKVYYVEVAPGHVQNAYTKSWNEEHVLLAMKLVRFDKTTAQELEMIILTHSQTFAHNHIVQVVSIELLSDAVLIFMEPADCNLHDYMNRHCPSRAMTPISRMQRLEMFAKFSDVLVDLHDHMEDRGKKVHLIHNDFRAEKILIMPKSPGEDVGHGEKMLKLTDFSFSFIWAIDADPGGLDVGSTEELRHRLARTKLPAYGPHFAPESKNDNAVAIKSDVWAFGTVLAELVAWIAHGASGLADLELRLSSEGTFFEVDKQTNALTLASGVIAWFERLVTDGSLNNDERKMYHDCWNLLKNFCLVCDPSARGSMEEVRSLLRIICRDSKGAVATEHIPSASEPERDDTAGIDSSRSLLSNGRSLRQDISSDIQKDQSGSPGSREGKTQHQADQVRNIQHHDTPGGAEFSHTFLDTLEGKAEGLEQRRSAAVQSLEVQHISTGTESVASLPSISSHANISMSSISSLVTIPSLWFTKLVELIFPSDEMELVRNAALTGEMISCIEFQAVLQRSLEVFGLSLKRESSEKEAKIAGRVIRSRAAEIAGRVISQADVHARNERTGRLTSLEDLPHDTTADKISRSFVTYGTQVGVQDESSHFDASEDLENEEDTGAADSGEESGEDVGGIEPEEDFTALKIFILQSQAYQDFKDNLIAFISLNYKKGIKKILESTPEAAIRDRLSQQELRSFATRCQWLSPTDLHITDHETPTNMDYVKAFVEETLEESWNWWPLSPRLLPLAAGYSRVRWRCGCGVERIADILTPTAHRLKEILQPLPPWICSQTTSLDRSSSEAKILAVQQPVDPVNSPPASAVASSTPNAAGGAQLGGPNIGTGATPSSRTKSGTGISGAISNTASSLMPHRMEEHLFMIVRRGSSFPVADMEVKNWDDPMLFRQLRHNYKELRGGLRQWLSWWRYGYSEFFRFQKYAEKAFVPRRAEFPPDADPHRFEYRYSP